MKIHDRIRKCGLALGWALFLGGLAGALWLTSGRASQGSGPVTMVCIQTRRDADSILLVQEGAAVLIDAGEESDAPHILEVLEEYGVEMLDCLILTHSDQDHTGGAARVLEQVPAGRVIRPWEDTGQSQSSLQEVLARTRIRVTCPVHTLRLRAGEMRILVYPPLERHYADPNNYSLAVLMEHGEVTAFFGGDALRKRSEELLLTDWPAVDLYKVPHHGRANSATGALFDALRPRFGVVTAGSADEAVVQAARRNGTRLFYTGQGDCTFVSDGRTLEARP